MKLSNNQLNELLLVATEAAECAGKLIQGFSKENLVVASKQGGNSLASQVVTEVDVKSQEVILELLKPTFATYDLGLLTEELADDASRFQKDYFWCIDPLDGTLPFTEQKSGYSVSIALVSKAGESVLGVVFDPVKGNLYSASKGSGAFKNGLPWQITFQDNLTFICDRSFLKHEKYQETIRQLSQKNELKIIKHGGAAMNAIWVLEQAPALYLKYPKIEKGGGSVWDYAATHCIFEALGFVSTDFYGNPLKLNEESIFMNQKGVVYRSDK